MNYDPYQSPSTLQPQPPPLAHGHLSQRAAMELLGTQAWVRFVSVLMLIASGFMFLSVILSLMEPRSTMDTFSSSRSSAYSSGYMLGQLVMVLLVALLYLYPSILLSRYASAIRRFRYSQSMVDVEAALRHQRFFWRFVGIVSIVTLALFILAVVLGATGAMFRYGRF
jgi:magnesium-transporting ATPase (P-type)